MLPTVGVKAAPLVAVADRLERDGVAAGAKSKMECVNAGAAV